MAETAIQDRQRPVSMLLAFRAANVRSFLEPVSLSLEATRLSKQDVVREIAWRSGGRPLTVLPAAGIFGANASGKSNLLKAMHDMRGLVLSSFRHGRPGGGTQVRNFLLGKGQWAEPTSYEVDLVLDEVRHEYGFVLNSERVLEEWAYSYPRGRSNLLFHRDEDGVRLGSSGKAKGRATVDILRPNALFLSTAAAAEHPTLSPIYEWFRRNLLSADMASRTVRQGFTAEALEYAPYKDRVLSLLREADLGITGATRQEVDPEVRTRLAHERDALEEGEDPSEPTAAAMKFEDFEVRLKHQCAEGDVELAATDESLGTLIWFGLAGPVIDALSNGLVLLADELDASLHPNLVDVLVGLFQSKQSNPLGAQLIFNSHDVTLMGDSNQHTLGRDQIWFTEKDDDGATRLYPLTDMAPRKGEAVGRRYLAGRYGATPIISSRQLERVAGPAVSSGEE
jgi:hypothetical protein